MACRSSQLRWRRFLSSAKGRTCSPRRANGAARTLLTPLLVSLRPLGHGRERVGEELPLPLHPVLGQELRRPRRRGHPPNPRHRPLRAVVEEVAALGQQGVETDAELPRSAAPRRAPRRAVGPRTAGGVGPRTAGGVVLPARLRDGPSPELCYEPFALCFQVPGLNLARLEDRFCFLRAFLGVALRG